MTETSVRSDDKPSSDALVPRRGFWVAAFARLWPWADLLLALLVAAGDVIVLVRSWQRGGAPAASHLLPLVLALFVAGRIARADRRFSAPPSRDGLIGTALCLAAPAFFRPNLFVIANSGATLLYALTNLFYFAVIVWAYLALERSIAILPAARAVVASGPYRILRHPIYASYVHLAVCYTAYFPSLTNAMVTCALVLGVLLRVGNEERLLSEARGYRDLQARVRHRYTGLWFSLPAAVTVALLIVLQY